MFKDLAPGPYGSFPSASQALRKTRVSSLGCTQITWARSKSTNARASPQNKQSNLGKEREGHGSSETIAKNVLQVILMCGHS